MICESVEFLHNFPLGHHAMYIYDDRDSKVWLLLHLIYSAFVRDFISIDLLPDEEITLIKDIMKTLDIKLENYELLKQLEFVSSREFYLEKCEADKMQISEAWKKYRNISVTHGFKGMVVAGDLTCFIEQGLKNKLIDYELSLGKELVPSHEMAGLCLYNACSFSVLNSTEKSVLIQSHGSILHSKSSEEIIEPHIDAETHRIIIPENNVEDLQLYFKSFRAHAKTIW